MTSPVPYEESDDRPEALPEDHAETPLSEEPDLEDVFLALTYGDRDQPSPLQD